MKVVELDAAPPGVVTATFPVLAGRHPGCDGAVFGHGERGLYSAERHFAGLGQSASADSDGSAHRAAGNAKAEVACRRGNYEAARGYIQTVTPAFTRKDVEAYQKRAFESLKAALNKPSPRS